MFSETDVDGKMGRGQQGVEWAGFSLVTKRVLPGTKIESRPSV